MQKTQYPDDHYGGWKGIGIMSTADIAALFGNALDNAIECEYTIEDKEKDA